MTIVPDTKDWTWVLQRPCPECGFDARSFRREDISNLIRDLGARWGQVLEGRNDIRQRPAADVWSPLEYGCHVRDVFLRFDKRLALMLTQHDPLFPNWDQDATAIADRYSEQNPLEVAVALGEAAESLAGKFDNVQGSMWERPGRRSDGAAFTVESFGRYLIHDPTHHLYDVSGRSPLS